MKKFYLFWVSAELLPICQDLEPPVPSLQEPVDNKQNNKGNRRPPKKQRFGYYFLLKTQKPKADPDPGR